jgi:hypothetical protein
METTGESSLPPAPPPPKEEAEIRDGTVEDGQRIESLTPENVAGLSKVPLPTHDGPATDNELYFAAKDLPALLKAESAETLTAARRARKASGAPD